MPTYVEYVSMGYVIVVSTPEDGVTHILGTYETEEAARAFGRKYIMPPKDWKIWPLQFAMARGEGEIVWP